MHCQNRNHPFDRRTLFLPLNYRAYYISGFTVCQGVWEVVLSVVTSEYVGVVEMGGSIGSGLGKDSIDE